MIPQSIALTITPRGHLQSFGVFTKNTNYKWYNRHFHVIHFFFNSLARFGYLPFPLSLNLNSVVSRDSKVHNSAISFFCWLFQGLVVWPRLCDLFVSQNPRGGWGIIIFIIILLLIRVFHISVNWWYFIGDWVTASLPKSLGLFSVFWPFLIMLLFGWSPLGRQLPNLPGPLIIL